MKILKFFILLIMLASIGCVGDDLVNDFVEPELRIMSSISTLAVGDTYQLEAQFFNNVGIEQELPISWESSNDAILSIDTDGLISGLNSGRATVTASVEYQDQTIVSLFGLEVDQETIVATFERSGNVQTTTFYNLRGDFVLSENGDGLTLSFADNYFTDDALPGLYIYLTNNPNSIRDALEIQEVTIFEGAHSYDIPDAGLNDYSHVLYFCKPFNVKVGDGEIE